MEFRKVFRSKLEKEVEQEYQKLKEIQEIDINNTTERMKRLQELASKVGASISPLYPGHGEASIPEIIRNIHLALQTKAMLAAVRTSSNYVIVSIILAFIAFFSMVAAFIAGC